MLLLSRAEVEASLDLDALRAALSPAMVAMSAGRTQSAPRSITLVPEQHGLLGAMAAYVPDRSVLAAKLVTVYPDNPGQGRPSHQAVIVVFDPATGVATACMDGTAITALRTAAGSALATDHLARMDASVLSILGHGVQAASHVRALARVRSFEQGLVYGRDSERASRFAAAMEDEVGLPMRATPLAEALSSADVIAATTHADEPVVLRQHVRPGTHINSVGLNLAGREVDPLVVRDAVVVVESRAAALAPASSGGANDLTSAVRDGLVSADDIREIGEVIAGTRPGRASDDDITLYKSVGVAVQDAVAAHLVLEAVRAASGPTQTRLAGP
jgi:ornithine cyclodeaminase